MFVLNRLCNSLAGTPKFKPLYFELTKAASAGASRWKCTGTSFPSFTNIYEMHPQLQERINKQIHTELSAFYAYMALGSYYENYAYGLKGFVKMQDEQIKEEMEHASVLTKLMHLRQCRVILQPILPPEPQNWSSPLEAVKATLQIEMVTANGLKDVLTIAEELEDHHVAYTVRHKLYNQQMKCLHETTELLHKLEHCSSPECLLIIDQSIEKGS